MIGGDDYSGGVDRNGDDSYNNDGNREEILWQ